MNLKTIAIAIPLLALVAVVAVRRTRSSRQSVVPQPQTPDAAPSARDAIAPAEASKTSPDPQQTAPATDPRLHAIGEAIQKSYASTVAAFALHGEEADYVAHDAEAERDADQVRRLFSSMRGELSPDLAEDCEAVVDRIAAAQLQLMAFAINRKNRGLPEGAQAETELADRKAFQEDTAPHFERIVQTLGIEGVKVSP